MGVTDYAKFATLGLLGLGLSACGGPSQAEIDAMIKAANLSKSELAAYKVCSTDMTGASPVLVTTKGLWKMARVPTEVCICQSKTLAAIFKEDKFTSHPKFVSYVSKVKKKKLPKLNQKELKPGYQAETVAGKLEASLLNCTIKYQQDNQEASAGLLEKIIVKEKKVVDEKDGKEKHAGL
jgi:hypothetical protein